MALLHTMFDALPPGPGESVWSYPETPRIERSARLLMVRHNQRTIARTCAGLRVLANGHPPVYFFPLDDIDTDRLALTTTRLDHPHRGEARYFDVTVDGRRAPRAAWTHPQPDPAFAALKGCIAFHADRVDGAFVDGERVIAQPGGVLGGWITHDIIGPFKGAVA